MPDEATIQDYTMIDDFISKSLTDFNKKLFGEYDAKTGYFDEITPEEDVPEIVSSAETDTPVPEQSVNQDMLDIQMYDAVFGPTNGTENNPGTGEMMGSSVQGTFGAVGAQTATPNNPTFNNAAKTLTPETYLKAIFGPEAGTTGVDPSGLRGTASGKYGITNPAKKDIYNRYYKNNMSYDEFAKKFNTDSAFEYDVAKKLASEKINSSDTVAQAIGSWYSPAHAKAKQWDTIPRQDYGNKLTVRQYVNKALKSIKQTGGPVATTPEEQYTGLNDQSLDTLFMPLKGQNPIRGLDSGEPIQVTDQKGKSVILRGPKDVINMKGPVYEKRISPNLPAMDSNNALSINPILD